MSEEQEMINLAETLGYQFPKYVKGRGVCGLSEMIFTTGIVYNIDEVGYQGRYCYHTKAEALRAFIAWDGIGDPPGNWIKHKGRPEYRNPNYKEQ